MRKYEYNENYFENIDTKEKAYWLGFLYADGYVRKRKKSGELRLKLKSTDKSHLEKFKKVIESSNLIKDGIDVIKSKNNTYYSHYSFITISSVKLANDLIDKGWKCFLLKNYK